MGKDNWGLHVPDYTSANICGTPGEYKKTACAVFLMTANCGGLTLGVGRSLASTLETGLFALLLTRIAGQQARLSQRRA